MKQILISGRYSSEKILEILLKYSIRKVFIVHGNVSYNNSTLKKYLEAIRDIQFVHYSVTQPNPDLKSIVKAIKLFKTDSFDAILAVGGGSVIDTAKLVLLLSSRNTIDITFRVYENIELVNKLFIAIPTTAGSGSESTEFAVIYKNSKKYSLSNKSIIPRIVILDPELTLTCSEETIISTAVDALCQAIESWWSKASTDKSKKYSIEAIKIILDNIFKVLQDKENIESRSAMLEAANISGRAINIAKTTAGHALSYGLTSILNVPHGIAVFLIMNSLVEIMETKYNYFANNSELDIVFSAYGETFADGFKNLFSKFENSIKFSKYNNWAGTIDELLLRLYPLVNTKRLKNNPIKLEQDDIKAIYYNVIKKIIN